MLPAESIISQASIHAPNYHSDNNLAIYSVRL